MLRHSTDVAVELPRRSLRPGSFTPRHRHPVSGSRRSGFRFRSHPAGASGTISGPAPFATTLHRATRCTASRLQLPVSSESRCSDAADAVVPPARPARPEASLRSSRRRRCGLPHSPTGRAIGHRMSQNRGLRNPSAPNTKLLTVQYAVPVCSGFLLPTSNPARSGIEGGETVPIPAARSRLGSRRGAFHTELAGHRRCEQRTASLSQWKACDEKGNADQCAATGRKPDCHH